MRGQSAPPKTRLEDLEVVAEEFTEAALGAYKPITEVIV